jgi:hypothetical protein
MDQRNKNEFLSPQDQVKYDQLVEQIEELIKEVE